MTVSDGQKNTQLRHDFDRQLRSSSPAVKRPASDMGAQDREDHTSDVDMDRGSSPPAISITGTMDNIVAPETTPKAKQQDTGVRHERGSSVDVLSSNPKAASQQAPTDESASTTSLSDSILQNPGSNASTSATSIDTHVPSTMQEIPTIDEQVARVMDLMSKPPQDKQKGYVVSNKWLNRVRSRSSITPDGDKFDKSATEGEIGPVDNSDLVLITEGSGYFHDEAGEKFVPLKPGLQLGYDYQMVPEEAWKLIYKWYGNAKESPVITRYVHDTSTGGGENCEYELNPPIFSLLKLPAGQVDSQDEMKPPMRTMASRSTSFNAWLKSAKSLVGIKPESRVRVWKVLGGLKSTSGSGMLTPAASRSASPAPGVNIVASAGDRMVLDVDTFTSLRIGDERELLDFKDQTMNDKYNGSQTLGLAGLSKDEVIVLEEQVGGAGGGEWPSDGLKSKSRTLGVSKSGAAAEKVKGKSLSSGRSSPAPGGMMTRGRQRKDGRPRGITGLQNLGNTCYMNSALQCVRSVEELTQYFLHGDYTRDLNYDNPLGHRGMVAKAYASLLNSIYAPNGSAAFSPTSFKATIGRYGPNFSGYGQQDSQEFVLFLLDGLQEDLNRIQKKPYIEKPDSTDEMVHDPAALTTFANKNWEIYKARNDSVITDLFAGMYKSTVTCPVCDKVSIIFDPFNNLTLQLPIENNWSKEIWYHPLNSRPIRVDVDIDKNAPIRALKEFVAKRVNSEPERLIMAESYKNKFYRMFDDVTAISEASIQSADNICIYEVDSVPTNYNPKKPKKTLFTYSKTKEEIPDMDSPEADRLLVPVFHRVPKTNTSRNKHFFGEPWYVVISREDGKDYNSVLRKILGKVATMTTKKILDDENIGRQINTPEDSDTVVMHDDDHSSDSNQLQTVSVEGEDGFVDVSMKNAEDNSPQNVPDTKSAVHSVLQPGSFIPPILQNLFQLKVVKSGEVVPLGWNQIQDNDDYPSISERALRQLPHRPAKRDTATGISNGESSSHTSDEDNEQIPPINTDILEDDSDGASIEHDQRNSRSGSDASEPFESVTSIMQNARPSAQRNGKQLKTYSRKAKKPSGGDPAPRTDISLIHPGEGILLDWTWEAWDALFEGTEDDTEDLKGSATWKNVELYHDEELIAKRAQRLTRRRNGITLDDCLNEFGKLETLSESNAWYCPRCKEHRQAQKKFELWRTPDILVMHLKRFSSNRNFRDKLDLRVDFPVEGLDLTGKVLMPEEGKSLVYDLIAVDNHYGGLGGGHYTAFAQNFYDKDWYEYNDSSTHRKSDPNSVVTPAAYLLFYRRRSDHPLGGEKLEKILDIINGTAPADSNSQPTSRDASPSGEGPRLGDSSHNGLSSAFTAAGQVRHVGDGGSAPIRIPGAYQEDENLGRQNGQISELEDNVLPGYEASQQMHAHQSMELDGDEGVDMSYPIHGPSPPWADDPSWSFGGLSSGRAVSTQQMACPPGSLDFSHDRDEDLFTTDVGGADDGASTKAEGGLGSSTGNLSDADERMGDFEDPASSPLISRGMRESAPPPLIQAGDEEEEMPVVELHMPDEE